VLTSGAPGGTGQGVRRPAEHRLRQCARAPSSSASTPDRPLASSSPVGTPPTRCARWFDRSPSPRFDEGFLGSGPVSHTQFPDQCTQRERVRSTPGTPADGWSERGTRSRCSLCACSRTRVAYRAVAGWALGPWYGAGRTPPSASRSGSGTGRCRRFEPGPGRPFLTGGPTISPPGCPATSVHAPWAETGPHTGSPDATPGWEGHGGAALIVFVRAALYSGPWQPRQLVRPMPVRGRPAGPARPQQGPARPATPNDGMVMAVQPGLGCVPSRAIALCATRDGGGRLARRTRASPTAAGPTFGTRRGRQSVAGTVACGAAHAPRY